MIAWSGWLGRGRGLAGEEGEEEWGASDGLEPLGWAAQPAGWQAGGREVGKESHTLDAQKRSGNFLYLFGICLRCSVIGWH